MGADPESPFLTVTYGYFLVHRLTRVGVPVPCNAQIFSRLSARKPGDFRRVFQAQNSETAVRDLSSAGRQSDPGRFRGGAAHQDDRAGARR